MKIIRNLTAALIAAVATTMPALARVDPGTSQLLQTVDATSVTVVMNDRECDKGNYYGSWNRRTLVLRLCTFGEVDAEDHDTVRHEVWHIIQQCTHPDFSHPVPVFTGNDYEDYILANISARDLQRILKSYPKAHQVVEVEAFVAANQLTSSDIEQVFKERCLS